MILDSHGVQDGAGFPVPHVIDAETSNISELYRVIQKVMSNTLGERTGYLQQEI